MKQIYIIITLLHILSFLNSQDLYSTIEEVREKATTEQDFKHFLKLVELRENYYKSIPFYKITDKDRELMAEKGFPLGGILIDRIDLPQALEVLFFEAETLSQSAMIYLDILYRLGLDGKMSRYNHSIFNFWKKLANDQVPKANYYLGAYYISAQGVEQSYDHAITYFKKALDKIELPEARYYLASSYLLNGNDSLAISNYKIGFLNGDSDCGYHLGVYYRDKEEYSKAFKYFIDVYKIAPKDIPTNISLGQIYIEGWGVKKDPQQGFKHYLTAAELGSYKGQFMVGYLYLKGLGCNVDNIKGKKFLTLSAKQKYQPAIDLLNEIE